MVNQTWLVIQSQEMEIVKQSSVRVREIEIRAGGGATAGAELGKGSALPRRRLVIGCREA